MTRESGSSAIRPGRLTLWFGPQSGRLYFRTGATTAKLTRLRRNPQVRGAPSSGQGRPLGIPFLGLARILDSFAEPSAE